MSATLDIHLLNGLRETVEDAAADQLVEVRDGSGVIHRESFPQRRGRP